MRSARRSRAAGFCVFNDLGVVIDSLRKRFGVARIGYVDIDVHHGDGIYYPYESDPGLIVDDEDLHWREHNRPNVPYGVTHRTRVIQSVPPRSSRTTNVNVTASPVA